MVSVVIPTYNVDPYISRCIDSVLNQSYTDIEIVVVDDGSKDGTLSIVTDFQTRHPNIRIVSHTHNLGLMTTRRDGYNTATGEFMAFLDGDDALPPDAIAKLVRKQSDTGADIVLGDLLKIYTDRHTERRIGHMSKSATPSEVIAALIDNKIIHSLCGKLFKTQLFKSDKLQTFDHLTIGEDGCLLYQLVARARSIASIDDTVYNYYENKASSSLHVYGTRQIESIIIAYKTMAQVCEHFTELHTKVSRRLTRVMFTLYFERMPIRETRRLLRKHDMLRYGSAKYIFRFLSPRDWWFAIKRFVYVRTKMHR